MVILYFISWLGVNGGGVSMVFSFFFRDKLKRIFWKLVLSEVFIILVLFVE